MYGIATPGRVALAGDVPSEGEENEEAPWSAPPRIEGQKFVRTPRLPELDFGVVKKVEEVDEEEYEESLRRKKFYRVSGLGVLSRDWSRGQ